MLSTNKDLPLSVLTLELTSECNERCIHCYLSNKTKSRKSYLNTSRAKRIIDEFSDLEGEMLLLTGGEAFLHPGIFDIINHAKSKQIFVSVFSNGVPLKSDIISKLKTSEIDDIQISIYSTTPSIHDFITQIKGSHQKTIEAIQKLKQENLPVRLTCSVLECNWHEVYDLIEFSDKIGCSISLEFNIIGDDTGQGKNLYNRISLNSLRDCLQELINKKPEYTIKILNRFKQRDEISFADENFLNSPVCGAGRDSLYVNSDGTFSVCPGWNIRTSSGERDESLKTFWETNSFLQELRTLSEKSNKKCIGCKDIKYCVRCYARNWLETGDYLHFPDYACQFAKIAHQVVESYQNKHLNQDIIDHVSKAE